MADEIERIMVIPLRNCLLVLIMTHAGTRRFCFIFLLSLAFIAGGFVLDMIISSLW